MKSLDVYLMFSGNCEEALNFYKHALNGEILSIQRFGDAPMEVPENEKNHILHSEFRAEGVYFMASDGAEHTGDQSKIALTVTFTDLAEQETAFQRLADGGQVTMPLDDTFWGDRFGMLTDRYGIRWMLTCENRS